MGRKSVKGKEKKRQRKEESAKIAISQAKVDAANKLDDPMSLLLAFKKFERNGLNLTIECKKVTEMDPTLIEWVFQQTKSNMQKLYEDSDWGWKDREKRDEMTEDKAMYLIASNSDGEPQAFSHFRFDLECEDEVVYCYELQLVKEVRRKGLGKFMMQILELLAHKTEMIKVMTTCFKHNAAALDFFMKSRKYEIDETSPDDPVFDDGYCYHILSKAIPPKKVATTATEHAATVRQTEEADIAELTKKLASVTQ